jgi:hypothetical protein
MKVKLLRKLRKLNPIYQRGNKYQYHCKFQMHNGRFSSDKFKSTWTKDLNHLLELRRNEILNYAIQYYSKPKRKL